MAKVKPRAETHLYQVAGTMEFTVEAPSPAAIRSRLTDMLRRAGFSETGWEFSIQRQKTPILAPPGKLATPEETCRPPGVSGGALRQQPKAPEAARAGGQPHYSRKKEVRAMAKQTPAPPAKKPAPAPAPKPAHKK